MAKLTIKEATPVPPPKVYTLELTEAEARGLRTVLGAGINTRTSAALGTHSIWVAMEGVSPLDGVTFGVMGQSRY